MQGRAETQGWRERGAGYVEYVLIVSLVAIVLAGATRFFQNRIEQAFDTAVEEFEGASSYIVKEPNS